MDLEGNPKIVSYVHKNEISDGFDGYIWVDLDDQGSLDEFLLQVDTRYNYILRTHRLGCKVPLNVSILLTLEDIENDTCDPYNIDAHIWVYVTGDTAVSPYKLQKLITCCTVSLYIKDINQGLQTLFLNYDTILFSDKQHIPPVRKLCAQLSDLYQYNQYIISPLNPAADNLEVDVYKQFQNDKFKYLQYEEAISMAIEDLRLKYSTFKVLIIGPGLGNLVSSTYKHWKHITAVEKNPKVLHSLNEMNRREWKDSVEIVHKDARDFIVGPEYKLIVSEMLGSFGCNELFPEILSQASAEVMIPSYVETLVAPIYSKPLWGYEYPGSNTLNQQSTLKFVAEISGRVNALKGIFTSNLYGPYNITNLKGNNHCNSWFPIVFPVEEFLVEKGDVISVHFERISGSSVSYRWSVDGKQASSISMEL